MVIFEFFLFLFQVLLPVPDYVYTMLPLDQMKTMTFSITPVLFNVGINEKATLAHKMGLNAPQEKNNIDNFKALAEYYRRYKKLHLNTATSKNGKSIFFSIQTLELHSAGNFAHSCGPRVSYSLGLIVKIRVL